MIFVTESNSVTGDKLSPADQTKVLAMFVHRFTGDNKPNWANGIWKDGKTYPLQFVNDIDWLLNTRFVVKKNGRLNESAESCMSTPTWPNNPELRK